MDLPGIAEVADARLGAWHPGDAWLAGGTWLFSEPQPNLSRLLDLYAFGWPSLRVSRDGLEIGATCTLAELARIRAPQWRAAPLIGQCCAALLGSFKVWNAATVGGNLCLALPAGPMISLTSALDGTCTIWGPDGAARSVGVTDFVTGAGRNVLEPGELLRSVHLPARALDGLTAFRQLTAATPRPVQLRFASPPTPDELQASLAAAAPPYHDDVHGTPAWREAITGQLALEVLEELAPS
jgi:CO/xanthine dehydrogenase FAD-binding subunit